MNPVTRLKASMILALGGVITLSTLLLTALLLIIAPGGNVGAFITLTLGVVVTFHFIQWLAGPKIIELAYNVRPLQDGKYTWINDLLDRLSTASGLSEKPKPMIADVVVPNAFAYGNILTGYKVAVTKGLLDFPYEEVEAILGHELGHIKHRDVELMMVISLLPALILWLGRSLMLMGWFGGSDDESEASLLPIVGISLIAVSFVFNIIVLYVSRLREYYADSHSAKVVPDGARKLQRALARILLISGEVKKFNPRLISDASKMKALLISDPEVGLERGGWRGDIQDVVEWIKSRPKLMALEIFATHPDPAKRLRFLDTLC